MNDAQTTNKEDGVNREGLDYRAGYCEGLSHFLRVLNISALRATKKTEPGIRESFEEAKKLREAMLEKMRAKPETQPG